MPLQLGSWLWNLFPATPGSDADVPSCGRKYPHPALAQMLSLPTEPHQGKSLMVSWANQFNELVQRSCNTLMLIPSWKESFHVLGYSLNHQTNLPAPVNLNLSLMKEEAF